MTLPPYQYNGARSMVILHEQELRLFVAIWKEAKESFETGGTPVLPDNGNPTYNSYNDLLEHVLRCALSYMKWICEKLELPAPPIPPLPTTEEFGARADEYLEGVLAAWRDPLKDVPEERFDQVHKSRWGVDYCIDSMLEHAVMHPIRHSFQLENWMQTKV